MKTIVIVDDERSVRSALSNLLMSEGYSTAGFACAEDLLADSAALVQAGLFIIDVRQPGMSGFELFKALTRRLSKPAGILISGDADENMLWYAISLGAIAFLHKPIDIDMLLEHIRREVRPG